MTRTYQKTLEVDGWDDQTAIIGIRGDENETIITLSQGAIDVRIGVATYDLPEIGLLFSSAFEQISDPHKYNGR